MLRHHDDFPTCISVPGRTPPHLRAYPFPEEYYPGRAILWRLKRDGVRLRFAPRGWEEHFPSQVIKGDVQRKKSDGNAYAHEGPFVIVLAHVADFMAFG